VSWLGIAYLILSGVALIAAMAHAAQSAAVRTDPAQTAIAATCLGFGLFDLGVAMTSRATGAPSPSPAFYVAGGVGYTLICTCSLLTAWTLLERPITRRSTALVAVGAALGIARTVELGLFSASAGQAWEQSQSSPLGMATAIFGFVAACVWTAEGASARGEGRRYALAVLGFGLCALAFVLQGLLVVLGVLPPPALFGFVALPFVGFVQVLSSRRLIDAMRAGPTPSGDMARYQVLEQLGSGGMGDVFLARRKGPAGFLRDVVLKTLQRGSDDAEGKERFLAEARLAAQLRHPNIVDVYDLGEQPNGYFIVMEHIEGATLGEAIDRAREQKVLIPCDVIAELATELCRALGHAHAAHVIHRDIKPHNVMVTHTGVAKLIDFGIAQAQTRQQENEVAGTPGYLSPERWLGGPGTPASDIFALGVTLYELLTFERPFGHDDPRAFIAAAEAGTYPRLGTVRPDIPGHLAAAVHQCLLADPSKRPASAAALHALVEQSLFDTRVDLAAWMKTLFDGPSKSRPLHLQPTTPHQPRDAPTVPSR
jgi:serine/threonine-protein kinase